MAVVLRKGYLETMVRKLGNNVMSILELKRLEVVTYIKCGGKLVSGYIANIESKEFRMD